MSEKDQRRPRSPLESERGRTTLEKGVVSKIAGVAAEEVEGILLGGSASRAAGSFLGNVAGSRGPSQGISAEVGRTETAIDVMMGIEYGGNISQLAERVRSSITKRVEDLTGLRVTELNVTVSDVVFAEDRPLAEGPGTSSREGEAEDADETAELRLDDEEHGRRGRREG